jgi:rhodanese-related sulfurtransferase
VDVTTVRRIGTAEVEAVRQRRAQLVEVLPSDAYEREHLPGALSLPLGEFSAAAVEASGLRRDEPVVVYCYDHECDLSARGAAWLEWLGFTEVYDYSASKTAWLGAGHPAEGSVPARRRAGALARSAPACTPDDSGADVLDPARVVLGVVRTDALRASPDVPITALMQPAPPTVRPSTMVDDLAESMDADGRWYVLVTTWSGVLLGWIERRDLHGIH